jgi:hypothetical protein
MMIKLFNYDNLYRLTIRSQVQTRGSVGVAHLSLCFEETYYITFHSIGGSHQVLVHLAEQLQRRRFLEIDQSETRMACGAMFINGSELNKQSL